MSEIQRITSYLFEEYDRHRIQEEFDIMLTDEEWNGLNESYRNKLHNSFYSMMRDHIDYILNDREHKKELLNLDNT